MTLAELLRDSLERGRHRQPELIAGDVLDEEATALANLLGHIDAHRCTSLLHLLENTGGTHAAADAHGHDPVFDVTALHLE